jgi:predicted alpha/beta-fold hydrolase
MRARRVIRTVVVGYAVFCAILAVFLGELAFRPLRTRVTDRQSAVAAAARFGVALQDVSVTASDGTCLQGWFARPAHANGDAVILLHGVGDNRQGMTGFAELFLSNGFAVLLPDSRSQGESGGDFPTYGLKESDDVHRWFDWLAMQQHPKCVFGMGESMGAAILLQSVRKESRFCAVVAESSFASFRQIAYAPVQRLLLRATQHCLMQNEIQKELLDTPVSLAHLLRLELLQEHENTYCLNYLLLTVQDQQTMYKVAARYGQSLATDFRVHKHEFDEIVGQYPNSDLRSQLLFDLVAGVSLNWGGLDLTTELGYRIKPPRHTNGDVYFVHSDELGAKLDFGGLYFDSETGRGSKMSFSTFGDGNSLPRLLGLPDVFDGVETATDSWRNTPDVYGALQSEYVTYVLLALEDAGLVVDAVENGNDTDSAIAKAVVISEGGCPLIRRK